MMFYKNGGSDDFLRQSGMDMRKLGGLNGPIPLIPGASLKTATSWQQYVLDAPKMPPPASGKPFDAPTVAYQQIMAKLQAAAKTFEDLQIAGLMTLKEYKDLAFFTRGLTMEQTSAPWSVTTATKFANALADKLLAAKAAGVAASRSKHEQAVADAANWFALLTKWTGMTQAEFDKLVASFGADYDAAIVKVGDYTTKLLKDGLPHGHTAEVLDEAFDLRDKIEPVSPKHEWVLNTNGAWDATVKSFKGSGSWSYASAVALRDAVKAELALAKQAKAKGLTKTLTTGSKAAAAAAAANAALAAVAKANAQKITALLTDALNLYNQIQPLTGMTNDQYNALAVQSGMDAAKKTWTVEAATKFRDALQKVFHDASQAKLDADAKKAADDAAIKKILADTDAYFATQLANKTIQWTQAQYDANKATAKGAGDWTVDSATAFQKQVYALPITQITPTYIPPSGGGGGGGGGGSSTGFGEGMALFAPPTPEKPPVVTPAAPPKEEPKSSPLPLLALLGAAAYALSK